MTTPEARYDQLTDRAEALYSEGRQREALALFEPVDAELEPWRAELAHLKACLLGSVGETDAALRVLEEASALGAWWQESILTEDDDLATLQALPGFRRVVALSRERRVVDPTPPVLQVPVGEATGVLVALHGAGQRATHAARDWAGVVGLGYALLCVESSQLMSPMYRTWPDREYAAQDIARGLAALPEDLRGLPVIAAGFSAGGRTALDWALTAHPEPAAGVVVLAPALRELPAEASTALVPATVLIGSEDELLEVVEAAGPQLSALGLTVERLPGLGHEFPADFAARLAVVLRG